MTFRVRPGGEVAPQVARVSREQIAKALDGLTDAGSDPGPAFHDVRKRCKKMRALLRLVRPALGDDYREGNRSLRDLGRRLAPLRDLDSALECYDRTMERLDPDDRRRFAPVRRRLTLRRQRCVEEIGEPRRREAIEWLESERRAVDERGLETEGFGAIAPGAGRTYGRARTALAEVVDEPTAEAVHEWRKRVKYHRYHCRLLQDLWKPVMKARREELHRLSDLLGDHHDDAEMRALLLDAPADFEGADVPALLLALEEDQRALLEQALPLGRKLFAEKAKRWVARVEVAWEAESR